MRANWVVGIVLGLLPAAGHAFEPPRLIGDLSQTTPVPAGSRPHGFVELDGAALFAARPDDSADRLYRSNGSTSGTAEIARLFAERVEGTIDLAFATAASAYFVARTAGGAALWVTDGSAAGTAPLLADGSYQSPFPFFPVPTWVADGEVVYFLQGGNYAVPLELWRTDGTASGTAKIVQLAPTEGVTGAIARRGPNDLLLLVWEHFESLKIWRSDGTAAGTAVAVTIPVEGSGILARGFAATSGGFYFGAQQSGSYEHELWITDGTAGGTSPLASFDDALWESLAVNADSAYLSAESGGETAIWRSDGAPGTTRPIAVVAPGDDLPGTFEFGGGFLYAFLGEDDWSEGRIVRVPQSGGGFEVVVEACTGGYCSLLNPSLWFRLFGASIVFTRRADDAVEVWRCDENGDGAVAIAPLCAGDSCFVAGVRPVESGSELLFAATGEGALRELYATDGRGPGTRRLAGPLPSIPWSDFTGGEFHGVAHLDGGWLFAAADDDHGTELWHARDGGDSASLVVDLRLDRPGLGVVEPVGFAGDDIVFSLWNDDRTRTLHRHEIGGDGVEPFLTVPIVRGRYGSSNAPPSLRLAGNAWFFFESAIGDALGDYAQQLWRYDPDSRDLRPLFADPLGTGVGTLAHDLHEKGSNAYFLGSTDATFRPAIYRLRPLSGAVSKELDIPAGRVDTVGRSGDIWFLIEDFRRLTAFDLARRARHVVLELPEGSWPYAIALPGGALVASVESLVDGSTRTTLWRSDGTETGTALLASWHGTSGCAVSISFPPARADSPVLFPVESPCDARTEIWTSDGSAERTRPLRAFEGASVGVAAGGLRFRGRSYFGLSRPVEPGGWEWVDELWGTDGTPEGTTLVVVLPGSNGYGAAIERNGAAGEGAFYFPLDDGRNGERLWRSDGSAAGTRMAEPPGAVPAAYFPRLLATLGDQVLFLATSGELGTELWQADGALDSPAPVADLYPGPDSSRPELLAASDRAAIVLADDGLVGRELWEITSPSVAPCVDSPTTVCLANGRFRARALWRDFAGRSGAAGVVRLTADSGYFWFFSPENPELLLKVVDACGLPGFENFWAYSTGLTNVEVELEIVDSWSAERRAVRTEMGQPFAPVFDSGSFRVCEEHAAVRPLREPSRAPANASGATLPLLGGRFVATADWRTASGAAGAAIAVPLADTSGYFWFFDPSNVEIFVKMVDACDLAGFENYWLFAGGLTDVAVTLTVRDLWSGVEVVYSTESGAPFPPLLETGRFDGCP